jgi:hypothetical protein
MQQLHSHVQDAGHRNSTFSECWSPSVKMTFPVNSLVRSHSNHYNLGKNVSLEDVKIRLLGRSKHRWRPDTETDLKET